MLRGLFAWKDQDSAEEGFLSLFERLIDRGDEQFGGVAVVLSVDEAFRRLIHIDLACDGIERGLHERIHGGGGFT